MRNRVLKDIGLATVVSFLLGVPFAILDLRANGLHGENGRDFFLLFGLMWLLPMIFTLLLLSVARTLRGPKATTNYASLILRMVSLGVIAFMWTGLLMDQLPCFVGVPNCD